MQICGNYTFWVRWAKKPQMDVPFPITQSCFGLPTFFISDARMSEGGENRPATGQ